MTRLRANYDRTLMDHSYIEEYDIADRYLMGKLSVEERTRFEEHFVSCAECLDRLETTEAFLAALSALKRGHVTVESLDD